MGCILERDGPWSNPGRGRFAASSFVSNRHLTPHRERPHMAAKKETQTITAADVGELPPEAPGADTAPPPADTPAKRNRHSFYPDGLDYVLVSVQTDDQGESMPNGALSAVPGQRNGPKDEDGNTIKLPLRFESAQEGERWVRASGDQLAGQLIICVRMMWRLRVLVQQKPVITVTKDERFLKPREAVLVADPAAPAAAQ